MNFVENYQFYKHHKIQWHSNLCVIDRAWRGIYRVQTGYRR